MLDLVVIKRAPDRRPVTPAQLIAADVPAADADSLAEDVADWWRRMLRRQLWANTYSARVPGKGHQILEIPRWPIWDNPPVVSTADAAGVNQGAYEESEIRVAGNCRQLLHRFRGWQWTAPVLDGVAAIPLAGLENPSILVGPDPDDAAVVGFRAGFVMPGELATWTATTEWAPEASTSYDSGAAYGWARSTNRTAPGLLEVVGGSGVEAAEPVWPTVDGESVVGANATFTLRLHAAELPRCYTTASLVLARKLQSAQRAGICDEGTPCCEEILAMVKGAC